MIAVNMSTWLPAADGLSYTQYQRLTKTLGEQYSERLVSSENVLTDFRVRRVQREIIAFANACEIQRQIQESAIRRIKPGISTREDIGWVGKGSAYSPGNDFRIWSRTRWTQCDAFRSFGPFGDRIIFTNGVIFSRGTWVSGI